MAEGIEGWFAGGKHVRAGGHEVFARVEGSENDRWVTLLHGFPTCSYDWAPIVPALTGAGHRLLMFDFIGFGDSQKPRGKVTYAMQLRALRDLWDHLGIDATAVIAHDYGVSVGQELLASREARVRRIVFLNGGLFSSLHRPLRVQSALQKPVIGPLIARAMNERAFAKSMRRIFSPEHQPTDEELHEHWIGITRRDGTRNFPDLIRYIDERAANADRWRDAIADPGRPIGFVWGDADPISGAHMIAEVRKIAPDAQVASRPDIGHYPQLEDPDWVAGELIRLLRSG